MLADRVKLPSSDPEQSEHKGIWGWTKWVTSIVDNTYWLLFINTLIWWQPVPQYDSFQFSTIEQSISLYNGCSFNSCSIIMMTYIYSLFARTNFEGVTRDLNHALTENVFTCFPAINLFGSIKYTDKNSIRFL